MSPAARTFAWWLAAPAILSSIGALTIGLWAGQGLALSAILAVMAAGFWFASRAVWTRWGPGSGWAGAGIGFLMGLAACGVTYGAFVLDGQLGPSLGGSLAKWFIEGNIDEGIKAGVGVAVPGGPGSVLTAPAAIVTVPAGALAGALVSILAIMAVCALPILTGLIGGAVAARRRA